MAGFQFTENKEMGTSDLNSAKSLKELGSEFF